MTEVSLAACFQCKEVSLARTAATYRTLLGPFRQTRQEVAIVEKEVKLKFKCKVQSTGTKQ